MSRICSNSLAGRARHSMAPDDESPKLRAETSRNDVTEFTGIRCGASSQAHVEPCVKMRTVVRRYLVKSPFISAVLGFSLSLGFGLPQSSLLAQAASVEEGIAASPEAGSELTTSAHIRSWPHTGSDLPPDPRITWGELDNGLRYAILPHANRPITPVCDLSSMWVRSQSVMISEASPIFWNTWRSTEHGIFPAARRWNTFSAWE